MTDSTSTPTIEVENLRVTFGSGRRHSVEAVRGISFSLAPGECLALVGESGSGKSVTSRTLVGLAGDDAVVSADVIRLQGRDVTKLTQAQWREVRGREVGFVLQDALASLDPLRKVGQEIAEPLALHTDLSKDERARKVVSLLESVGVPEPEVRARQHPFELSGGLRQRALIASAIACDPALLIADEPTTALDATIAAQVLGLLNRLKSTPGSLFMVSHDLAVVARLADRIAVMQDGRIVEQGSTLQVLEDPQHGYTKRLLAAIPSHHARGSRLSVQHSPSTRHSPTAQHSPLAQPEPKAPQVRRIHAAGEPAVRAENLTKRYRGPDGMNRTVVSDVSFSLRAGKTLGIVGESGSGKTTSARLLLGVEQPDEGQVLVHGVPWQEMSSKQRRRERRFVQAIYQDPLSSFDPRYTVRRVLLEALGAAGHTGAPARRRAVELLGQVRLEASFLDRRPALLSGGQRQRVAIARALAADPEVIVCDEPVSALDVSVQAQILDLLVDLQSELGIAYLFISHDLGVVNHLADDVLVMKDGVIVESGPVDEIFENPQADYTRSLLAAIPRVSAIPRIDDAVGANR